MKEPIAKIVVQNPALASTFTTFVGVIPVTQISVIRSLSHATKFWVMGIDIALMLAFIILAVYTATKKVELTLQKDGLQLYKRTYPLDEIALIKYYPHNRYLKVKNRRNLRSFTIYLGKQEEAAEKVAILQSWATQVGAHFQS